MCIKALIERLAHIASMLNLSSVKPVTRPAGSVLLRRGQRRDMVHHLCSGRVSVGLLGEDGRLAHQLGWLEGQGWLDLGSAVLGLPPVLDAVAETSVQLQQLPQADFAVQLQGNPLDTQSLLGDLAQAYRQQAELAVNRLGKDAEARLADWLLRQSEPIPGPASEPGVRRVVALTVRKRTIAAQLGIAPETLSRMLRQLRERQLISGSGRQLNLLNVEALRRLAG